MENAVGVPPMRVKSGAGAAEEVEAIQAGAEPASASICLRVILRFSLSEITKPIGLSSYRKVLHAGELAE
jgi:head-tail adaptor